MATTLAAGDGASVLAMLGAHATKTLTALQAEGDVLRQAWLRLCPTMTAIRDRFGAVAEACATAHELAAAATDGDLVRGLQAAARLESQLANGSTASSERLLAEATALLEATQRFDVPDALPDAVVVIPLGSEDEPDESPPSATKRQRDDDEDRHNENPHGDDVVPAAKEARTDEAETAVLCPLKRCGTVAATTDDLQRHVADRHGAMRQCCRCGQVYATQQTLATHVQQACRSARQCRHVCTDACVMEAGCHRRLRIDLGRLERASTSVATVCLADEA
jgi:uncharacterized C2H2 Zn-finger protein